MEDVLDRVENLARMLECVNGGCLTVYSPEFRVEFSTSENIDVLSNFLMLSFKEQGELPGNVDDLVGIGPIREDPIPNVFSNTLGMVWLSDVWVFDGKIRNIAMIGPVFMDDISVRHIDHELEAMHLSMKIRHRFQEYISGIPVISLNRFYEYGIMLHYCITGKKISVSEFRYPDIGSSEKKEAVFQIKHGTYAAERELLALVEQGNPENKETYDRLASIGDTYKISKGGLLRQEKDTVIAFAVLCSRAAIKGGLASETALTLCDQYVQRVENIMDLSTLTRLSREMFQDFVTRVHRQRQVSEQISPQILKICDYICLYPEEKNDIHTLAQMAGYADYYFSNKFFKETGKSVRDYVMEQRVRKAAGLLKETTLSVSEIGDLMGFGTQSYFGEVFRKFMGITPAEYRKQLDRA